MNEKNIKIAVIGGDIRQIYISNILADNGYSVYIYAINDTENILSEKVRAANDLSEASNGAFLMILPLPLSRDSETLNAPYFDKKIYLDTVFDFSSDIPYIAAGLVKTDVRKVLSDSGATVIDYALRDDFALKNAYLTVEGTLATLISASPRSLRGSVCGVTGYGKIGKLLVRTLISLGANVKVFARKELDRASASLEGASAHKISDMATEISDVDLLINTVPSVIIGEKELFGLSKSAAVIELASMPGGFDRHCIKKLGKRYINAQSLPGKYSPESASAVILESIFSSLVESEVSL